MSESSTGSGPFMVRVVDAANVETPGVVAWNDFVVAQNRPFTEPVSVIFPDDTTVPVLEILVSADESLVALRLPAGTIEIETIGAEELPEGWLAEIPEDEPWYCKPFPWMC
jgi:hypothetical protein